MPLESLPGDNDLTGELTPAEQAELDARVKLRPSGDDLPAIHS